MDTIVIESLEVYGYHGQMPEENTLGQWFLLDITLELDLRAAGRSDDLSCSVNYAAVCAVAVELVQRTRFCLLEALAEHVCKQLLELYPALHAVTLALTKPHPPIPHPLRGVGVQIRRTREDYGSHG